MNTAPFYFRFTEIFNLSIFAEATTKEEKKTTSNDWIGMNVSCKKKWRRGQWSEIELCTLEKYRWLRFCFVFFFYFSFNIKLKLYVAVYTYISIEIVPVRSVRPDSVAHIKKIQLKKCERFILQREKKRMCACLEHVKFTVHNRTGNNRKWEENRFVIGTYCSIFTMLLINHNRSFDEYVVRQRPMNGKQHQY